MSLAKKDMIVALLRISMGFIFLWAFFDKLLGLGFATAPDKAWLLGNSPTFGFLKLGTHGIFKVFFASLAGNALVDYLFMLGLLCVGIALMLGVAQKIATMSGTLMLFLMWLASPPVNNPFLDEHIIYIFVLQLLLHLHSGEVWGLAKWWKKTKLVSKYHWLV
ncbi:MAG: hypothetical protein HYT11_00995 [Candidatus Levybacteria bacterium]|nr:hypothetical protein [Candidatus Levybacteria bacterium]